MSLSIVLPEHEVDFPSEVSKLSKSESSSRESSLIFLDNSDNSDCSPSLSCGLSSWRVFCSVLQRIWIDYVKEDRPEYRFSLANNLLCAFSMNNNQRNL